MFQYKDIPHPIIKSFHEYYIYNNCHFFLQRKTVFLQTNAYTNMKTNTTPEIDLLLTLKLIAIAAEF